MLSRHHRLSRQEFALVFAAGTRVHSAYFTAVCHPGPMKVAVVAGKKVARQAVVRNRLRRRAYGVVAHHPTPLPQLIILYKPGAMRVSRQLLAADLCTLLARIKKAG